MGTGDKGGDVRIGEITLPDGRETRDCGVIVSCAGGSIRIGVLCCWRLEHLVGLKRGGGKLWMRDEMTLRLIHRISLDLYQKREHANKHEMLSVCHQCAYYATRQEGNRCNE